jgi:hypothetical protein
MVLPTPFHTSCVASALQHPVGSADGFLRILRGVGTATSCWELHELVAHQLFYCAAADFIGKLFSF